MHKYLILSVLSLLLSSCSTLTPDPAKQELAQATVPSCFTDRECELKWAAARKWVMNNAAFQLKTVTADYFDTFGPRPGSPAITMRVSKEPIKTGGYRLLAGVYCDNFIGCVPDAWDTIIKFNKDVNESAK